MKSKGSEYEEKARWPLEADSKASRRHTGPVETEAELADEIPLDDASDEDLHPEAAPEGLSPVAPHAADPHAGDPHAGDDEEEQHDDGDQFEGPGS